MLIETSDLRKVYGDTVAVDGLTLHVGKGEVFGFLGPNGAGKTTTVKMLLGLVAPTAGEARILGHRPGDPAVMGRVGFLPEQFRFHPWLTAAEFLDLHGQLYGLNAAARRQRIPDLLERVGLADRARSHLSEFSKGMLQRVGLAQALLNDPDLVFLDEPTSGLDPVGRHEVRDLIRELRERGVTIFLNSHFLSEVEVTCDRVAIVKRGRVVRIGTLDELTRGTMEVEIRAAGLTNELVAGLEKWGKLQIANRKSQIAADEPSDPNTEYPIPNTEIIHLTLSVADETILPAVADWLVGGGARVYALAPQRPSLEELFMRVMRETGSEGAEQP
ncbi:MAG: ABC transporter ATP-binding protein [Chloroflexi bacterium]|nr:ABC transporter ATP-binding protein [Chloroflexota bacterium]